MRARSPPCRNQPVELARRLDQPQRLALDGEVADQRPVPAAGQRVSELVKLVLPAGAEDERGAAPGERGGDRPAEAAGGPGEQDRLALEPHGRNL